MRGASRAGILEDTVHEPESLNECLIDLAKAIARAERWYAARERTLAEFDRRAADWRGRAQ
jgi:hypothetical protein